MKYRNAKMELFLSDARGIYIPRDFAQSIKRECVTGISEDDYAILENPDHEWYWEAWNDVLNNAVVTDPTSGTVYKVYQDGDCWLIEQGAEFNSEDCDLGEDKTGCSDMFVMQIDEENPMYFCQKELLK